MTEKISYEAGSPDAWVCICGNDPTSAGFYPIDSQNHEVEPTSDEWFTNQYFCNKCGRVIDQDSLEVVRQLDIESIITL